MKKQSMRDAFWDGVYEKMKIDKDIIIVSADFGAPSIDKIRMEFPKRYINVGIAEQNAILVATGLALRGKKPIVYAITQFITLRCFEQIRIYPCGMNLPITIVGVGAGACYWESGSTHHCLEQLSVMRTLPNLEIINCSSQKMAADSVNYVVNSKSPVFLQLDREVIHGISTCETNFEKGYEILLPKTKNFVVTTGVMTSELLRNQAEIDREFTIVDLFRIPINTDLFVDDVRNVSRIITIEENTKKGGVGSYVMELLSEYDIRVPVKCIGIDSADGYEGSYHYGGREQIRKAYRMGKEIIKKTIEEFFI